MLILLRDKIAVHDTLTGDLLWARKTVESGLDPHTPFITKDVCGYLTCDNGLHVYDTNGGDFIASIWADYKSSLEQGIIVSQGPYLAYTDNNLGLHVHVVKIVKKKATRYKFSFPSEPFAGTEFAGKYLTWPISIELIGFMAKTNVLIGNVGGHCTRFGGWECHLFSLDLDDATSATSDGEVESAFSVPLSSVPSGLQHYTFSYKPVYQTDRESGSVDIVGVMKKNQALYTGGLLTIDNYFFITEMEISNDF